MEENLFQLYYGDLYDAYKERYDELDAKGDSLNDFERGQKQAYWEILDSMKTRTELLDCVTKAEIEKGEVD